MKSSFLGRYSILAIVLWIAGALIIFQMFRVQNSPSAKTLLNQVLRFDGYNKTIYPTRGSIYDRWGSLLAGNEQVYEVGVNLEIPYDAKTIASTIHIRLICSTWYWQIM